MPSQGLCLGHLFLRYDSSFKSWKVVSVPQKETNSFCPFFREKILACQNDRRQPSSADSPSRTAVHWVIALPVFPKTGLRKGNLLVRAEVSLISPMLRSRCIAWFYPVRLLFCMQLNLPKRLPLPVVFRPRKSVNPKNVFYRSTKP